ncbi:MAG: adenylate/guanylate cyclase domain-containing protein [Leptospirales bacterium]|nr:adenylate/guanylate cyclase domain-containing protein [Leptospirales bacterium]
MTRRFKRKLVIVILSALFLGVVGFIYAIIYDRSWIGSFTAGFLAGLSIMSFEWFVVQSKFGEPLRRSPLIVHALISASIWGLLTFLWIRLTQHAFYPPEMLPEFFSTQTLRAFAVAIVVLLCVNFVMRVGQLIGGRVLVNFLFGRYNRPREENRIFLFLDITDSVQITERLGALRAHSVISRFFFDVAQIVMEHGGETHRYIGDETVVTWPQDGGVRRAAWLRCILAIRKYASEMAPSYEQEFGINLRFRAGMHCGPVVAGEVGDNKREIVYFGDTVNTSARIEAYCKETSDSILFSRELLAATNMPLDVTTESLGMIRLRGRETPIELFRILF